MLYNSGGGSKWPNKIVAKDCGISPAGAKAHVPFAQGLALSSYGRLKTNRATMSRSANAVKTIK